MLFLMMKESNSMIITARDHGRGNRGVGQCGEGVGVACMDKIE